VHAEPAPEAKIVDFQNLRMNVLLGAWCDTENHASVLADLSLAGKRVLDEMRERPLLTAKSARGDAPPK
jgi:hypothetical protein